MAAISTPDTRKAAFQDAASQVEVNNLLDIRSEELIFLCELIVIDMFQFLKFVLDTLVVLGFLGLSGMVNRGYAGHLPVCSRLHRNGYCSLARKSSLRVHSGFHEIHWRAGHR